MPGPRAKVLLDGREEMSVVREVNTRGDAGRG